jgi:hypothetical protein
MNIFFLHVDPKKCAQMHVDKHVVKLILETCQMLCAVWHVTDPAQEFHEPPYKLTHKNHPCTVWARTSVGNYDWLCQLGLELCNEYTYRYGKQHASQPYIKDMSEMIPPIHDIGFTTPAQAMPDTYKNRDPIVAYREYYINDKSKLHSWKGKIAGRDPPDWIQKETA